MTHDRDGDELTLGQNFDRLFDKLREVDSKEKRLGNWIIPVVLFLIIHSGAGIWWAADVSARLTVIEQKVELGTQDRYFGNDAIKDFKIRDDRLDFLQDQINELDDDVDELRKEINAHN